MNGIKALQIQRIEKEMRMRLAVTIQKNIEIFCPVALFFHR